MLKRLFTSNTRIKLLALFLSNLDQEFFIRELTRRLDEQINSIRRELDNLKKMGLLKSKTKNRKKYYYINSHFPFIEELRSIFKKATSTADTLAREIAKFGDVKLLALSGQLIGKPTETVDMLIVGDIDKDKLSEFIDNELRTRRPLKYAVMSEQDYQYRKDLHDKFLKEIIDSGENQIPIDKLA